MSVDLIGRGADVAHTIVHSLFVVLCHYKIVVAVAQQLDTGIGAGHAGKSVHTILARDCERGRCRYASALHRHRIRAVGQPIVLAEIDESVKIHERIPAIEFTFVQSIWSGSVATVGGDSICKTSIGHDIFDGGSIFGQAYYTGFQLIVSSNTVGLDYIPIIGVDPRAHGSADEPLAPGKTGFLCELIQRGRQELAVSGCLEYGR